MVASVLIVVESGSIFVGNMTRKCQLEEPIW